MWRQQRNGGQPAGPISIRRRHQLQLMASRLASAGRGGGGVVSASASVISPAGNQQLAINGCGVGWHQRPQRPWRPNHQYLIMASWPNQRIVAAASYCWHQHQWLQHRRICISAGHRRQCWRRPAAYVSWPAGAGSGISGSASASASSAGSYLKRPAYQLSWPCSGWQHQWRNQHQRHQRSAASSALSWQYRRISVASYQQPCSWQHQRISINGSPVISARSKRPGAISGWQHLHQRQHQYQCGGAQPASSCGLAMAQPWHQ